MQGSYFFLFCFVLGKKVLTFPTVFIDWYLTVCMFSIWTTYNHLPLSHPPTPTPHTITGPLHKLCVFLLPTIFQENNSLKFLILTAKHVQGHNVLQLCGTLVTAQLAQSMVEASGTLKIFQEITSPVSGGVELECKSWFSVRTFHSTPHCLNEAARVT